MIAEYFFLVQFKVHERQNWREGEARDPLGGHPPAGEGGPKGHFLNGLRTTYYYFGKIRNRFRFKKLSETHINVKVLSNFRYNMSSL